MATVVSWPSANEYMAAIQNPQIAFSDLVLRDGVPAVDRLGMPLVASGNFAYVFKMKIARGARAIKCFRQFLGDRERRYVAIDRHLDTQPLRVLAEFEYDPEGILVGSNRYPTVEMEWLEGPTLDVYVDAALNQGRGREALTTLAAEWARLVKQLDDGGVAHGDLQHGNVIVTSPGLRLVDLDGMYVPALSGSNAGEVGHPHFQHPRRTEGFFNSSLDRFPALVIYTSFLGLIDRPGLWTKYHDDNLIFKKDDFRDPNNSAIFRELRGIGGEVKRLVDALGEAALAPPSATPRLVDLVQVNHVAPSKLPSWMREPIVITLKTTSREADGSSLPKPSGPSPEPLRVSPAPVAPARPSPTAPTTPTSSASPTSDPLVEFVERLQQGAKRGFTIALYGIFPWCVVWFPVLSMIVNFLFQTAKRPEHWVLVVFAYLGLCLAAGLLLGPEKKKSSTQTPSRTPKPYSPQPVPYSPPVAPPTMPQYRQPSATSGPVIVSTIRMIYHRPSCSWAMKISRRNRTSYSSAAAAASAGNRACRVCQP